MLSLILLSIEIVMMILGIVTLCKGQLKFSENRIIAGLPAYFIGIIFTSTLPLLFVIEFIMGWIHAKKYPFMRVDGAKYLYIELIGIACSAFLALIIAIFTSQKKSNEFVKPEDSPSPKPEAQFSDANAENSSSLDVCDPPK
jgi:fructose-specific phosphotransferase system IIC component